MKVILPLMMLLGAAACSRESQAPAAASRPAAHAATPSADDSVAAVAQSPGKPGITLRFVLDGKPVAGAATLLRLDLAGEPGPVSVQLQSEGLVLEPRAMALTIPDDGMPASQLVSVTPQSSGLAEILAKIQSSADGGTEVAYAIPLLVEAAAAR
jgi:hypothetical protein